MRNNYYVYFFECPFGSYSCAASARGQRTHCTAAPTASARPGAPRVVCAAQCDGASSPHESFHGVAS